MPEFPQVEEFDSQEWKLLFKYLVENHGSTDGLTRYGELLLASIKRKLAIRVIGIDSREVVIEDKADLCPFCLQAIYYVRQD